MVHMFVLFYLWNLVDGLKSVSVTEGHPVTLKTDLTEMMDDDLILWRFGPKNTLIAQINVMANSMTVYDDVLDGRFRDRLKLDHQTGSLTITNTRTEHDGDYKLEINSVRKTIRLTVRASSSSSGSTKAVNGCDSAEAVLRLVVTALMGVAAAAAAVLLVNDVRSTRD